MIHKESQVKQLLFDVTDAPPTFYLMTTYHQLILVDKKKTQTGRCKMLRIRKDEMHTPKG